MEIKIIFSIDHSTLEFFRQKLENMERKLDDILGKETKIMSQLDDLNAAIQAEDVQIQTLVASAVKIDADVDALLAKIAAGASLPDITNALTAIQSHTAALASVNTEMVSADTKANG